MQVAKLPLHIFVGPELDVYTSVDATELWFNSCMINNEIGGHDESGGDYAPPEVWWDRGYRQLDLGVLLKMDGEHPACQARPGATELLLYTTVSDSMVKSQKSLLTPPRSSSPDCFDRSADASTRSIRSARLHARLISSNLYYILNEFDSTSGTSSGEDPANTARFLTPPLESFYSGPPLQKRQRLETLFDNAARENKRSRKRAGESLAKVMAGTDVASWRSEGKLAEPQVHSNGFKCLSFPTIQDQSRPTKISALSRSQSFGSIQDLDTIRPISWTGSSAPPKRSSLHRAASASHDSTSPAPDSSDSLEQQNKTALTRVVMAGLRLHGFQPKKKPAHIKEAVGDLSCAVSATRIDQASLDEEEYKQLYHQTFKAASFVFRNRSAGQIISQDVMRETVDRLLTLFCNDPMQPSPMGDTQPGSSKTKLNISQHVFDSPSGANIRDEAKDYFSVQNKLSSTE